MVFYQDKSGRGHSFSDKAQNSGVLPSVTWKKISGVIFFENPEKCTILTKMSALHADDMQPCENDMRTTCRRHITRDFGLKIRKKIGGSETKKKHRWGMTEGVFGVNV